MKKKIYKILGVALSLVMVFSLTAAFVPTSTAVADPDDNLWSEFKVPQQSTGGNWVLARAKNTVQIGPIAQAVDGSLYCFVGPTKQLHDTDYTLFKSDADDEGREWYYTGKVEDE